MASTEAHIFRRIVWPFGIAETLVWASFYYSFPALLPTWEQDMGWSKTELSGAFTLALVLSALLAPLAGRLIDRGHARQVFTGSAVMGAGFLLLLAQVQSLWQFYAVWMGLGIAMSGALYEACFAILTRSVGDRNKQAITLVTLVAGFAGTVSFPSAHALVEIVGWRGAVQVFAGAVLLVAVPLIWSGCRAAAQYAQAQSATAPSAATSPKSVLRSAVFWLLALSFTTIAVGHGVVLTHLLPILDDRGVSPETAVFAAAMIGPMQVAGRLAMMAAEKHVSIYGIAIGCFVSVGLAASCLLGAGGVTGMVVGFVILHGAGYGVTSITRPVITAEFLGKQNFGAISGLLAAPFMFGFALSPTLAALIWEFGGYDRVLQFAIAILVLGLMALLCAGRLSKPPQAS